MSDTSNSNSDIEKIFSHLNKWRNFPNYQLERRVDIFFSIYLLDFLNYRKEEFEGEDFKEPTIPEFPIKKKNDKSNRTVKVDYLVTSNKKLYFIELKTDTNSTDTEQLEHMEHARDKKESTEILQDVIDVAKHTKAKLKYYHLLEDLAGLKLLKPFVNKEKLKDLSRKNLSELLPTKEYQKIKIIYIVPNKEAFKDKLSKSKVSVERQNKLCIYDFGDFATFLDNIENKNLMQERFAGCLKKWGRGQISS